MQLVWNVMTDKMPAVQSARLIIRVFLSRLVVPSMPAPDIFLSRVSRVTVFHRIKPRGSSKCS